MIAQIQERLDIPAAMNAVGSVRAWQHILNGCCYQPRLILNGHLDSATIATTKRFQENLGLSQGEEVDLTTWQAGLKHDKYPGWPVIVPPQETVPPRPTAKPAPCNMSEAEKYEYYRLIIDSAGGKFQTKSNQRNLLGFRKETDVYANEGHGKYDDYLAMVWKTDSGMPKVREYKHFTTEPISRYEGRYGDDPNCDGRKDLGRIQEGYYRYKIGYSDLLGDVLRPLQEMESVRDIDHDGKFEVNEPKTSAGYSILIHKGGDDDTWSAGCQTLRKDDFASFWRDLNSSGNPGVIGYTLVRWS
jgi:hypothetical protein